MTAASVAVVNPQALQGDGVGCHSGKAEMLAAAKAAGKSETLDRYARDYPKGPHDQPQSMCPAFGSLRVGLRMRRTATILSGSACCVYGPAHVIVVDRHMRALAGSNHPLGLCRCLRCRRGGRRGPRTAAADIVAGPATRGAAI